MRDAFSNGENSAANEPASTVHAASDVPGKVEMSGDVSTLVASSSHDSSEATAISQLALSLGCEKIQAMSQPGEEKTKGKKRKRGVQAKDLKELPLSPKARHTGEKLVDQTDGLWSCMVVHGHCIPLWP